VSETERSYRPAQPPDELDQPAADRDGESDDDRGLTISLAWLRREWVTEAALVMIFAQVLWKATFLSHFYFRQDDFHFTELALQRGLTWKYLSYVGSGHFHPGVLLIVWIMSKAAIYNWDAASAVTIGMLAIASLAALRLLRTLIGNRPAILLPLALYLITPLTLPNDSWWQSAIESLPLQAVIFLSLTAHIHYVRSGRLRHLIAAAAWLAVGLFFFEKAAVIPLLLFGVTAAFLVEGRLASSARQSLVRYWRAWLVYGGLVAVYGVLLLDVLRSSTVQPGSASVTSSLIFSGNLIKDTLVPGLFGGPWTWYFLPPGYGQAIAYAAPASQLAWLTVLVAAGIVVASIMTRTVAWRAWAILAGWIVIADIGPVLLGRVSSFANYAGLFGLDTRYVADAAPVAAICLALVFWPVLQPPTGAADVPETPRAHKRQQEYFASQAWRLTGLGFAVVLVIGSIMSVNSYERATSFSDFLGRYYLANAQKALSAQLPPGTVIIDRYMPVYVMVGPAYLSDALQSAAIGPMATTASARQARWIAHPHGTINELAMFAPNGTLRRAVIQGAASPQRPGNTCWPAQRRKIVIPLGAAAPSYTDMLRVGYLASTASAGKQATVSYGDNSGQFTVRAGFNSVYIPVLGQYPAVTIGLAQPQGFCVGDVEVGQFSASAYPIATKAHAG
jgi:hypothetical protein